jgi:hypothetical protein
MLVTDPAERADVAAVMAHPWFRRELDPRLAAVNDALLAEHSTWPLLCRSCATSNEVRAVLRPPRPGSRGCILVRPCRPALSA